MTGVRDQLVAWALSGNERGHAPLIDGHFVNSMAIGLGRNETDSYSLARAGRHSDLMQVSGG